MTARTAPAASARKTTTSTKKKKQTAPLPPRPLLAQAPADGVDDPYVLHKPPPGKSGDLKVKKAVHDALCADPTSLDPHVKKLTVSFGQDINGARMVYLRLVLDDDAPTLKDLGEARLTARVKRLQQVGTARCLSVLGDGFHVQPWFGGKHFRP